MVNYYSQTQPNVYHKDAVLRSLREVQSMTDARHQRQCCCCHGAEVCQSIQTTKDVVWKRTWHVWSSKENSNQAKAGEGGNYWKLVRPIILLPTSQPVVGTDSVPPICSWFFWWSLVLVLPNSRVFVPCSGWQWPPDPSCLVGMLLGVLAHSPASLGGLFGLISPNQPGSFRKPENLVAWVSTSSFVSRNLGVRYVGSWILIERIMPSLG